MLRIIKIQQHYNSSHHLYSSNNSCGFIAGVIVQYTEQCVPKGRQSFPAMWWAPCSSH